MSNLNTWPFWAPSQHESVVDALELAGVGPGTRVLDLGCGDGSVLLVAAEMGADVIGIEADDELVDIASDNLAGVGVDADIVHGDLFDTSIVWDADVLFAYLAPATLQRLLPRLAAEPTRPQLVTVDFDVPGLIPSRRGDAARLYRLPGRRRRPGAPGWATAGTLVCTVPDVQSLTCLDLVHPAGDAVVTATWSDPSVVSVATGADRFDDIATLAVDLRWEEPAQGMVVSGEIETVVGSHHVFMVATEDEDEAQWDLTDEGVANLADALAGPHPPTTAAEAVDAANR